tara:strand:- start:105 stop:311 length:207 start_codon:yes stop_codon:yes gene_type:complete
VAVVLYEIFVSKSAVQATYLVTFLKVMKQVMTVRFAATSQCASSVWETSAPTSAHQHTVGMEVSSDGS